MKWHNCDGCGTEFRVVSDTDLPIAYCPYCGDVVEEDDEEEDEEID